MKRLARDSRSFGHAVGLGDLVGGGREALSVVGLVQRSFVEVRGREREDHGQAR